MPAKIVKTKKGVDKEGSLPAGFTPVGMSRVDGWFVVDTGNTLQGTIEDSFESTGQFGKRKVYKVKVTTNHETRIIDGEKNESVAEVDQLIGLDEKGFLKGLEKIPKGAEIYVRCDGKGVAKKGFNAPWKFTIGVDEKVPL